ncbi:MAG: DNA polymerase IV [Xanthomonadales bacterium]|nr:DNA polymerase IV [Xanthomonadales bacterium]
MSRQILHVDMDAFYASVEQRDAPALRGQPVIVGGSGRRGVVATCSYEARRFGVRSAMPTAEARRRCPDGVFLPPRMAHYQAESARIFEIFQRFTPQIEGLSLDEAFLDVTASQRALGPAWAQARRLKQMVQSETGLPCTVGLAGNKLLAKLASELGKPDGLRRIDPGQAQPLLAALPLERLWTVGAKTAERLREQGFETIGDLQQADLALLQRCLGPRAAALQQLALGIDERPVQVDRPEVSIGAEETLEEDLRQLPAAQAWLMRLVEKAAGRLRAAGLDAAVIQLKLRTPPFHTETRQHRLQPPRHDTAGLYREAEALLGRWWSDQSRPVLRLLGVSLTVDRGARQASLFDAPTERVGDDRLDQLEDRSKARFGGAGLRRARGLRKAPDGSED